MSSILGKRKARVLTLGARKGMKKYPRKIATLRSAKLLVNRALRQTEEVKWWEQNWTASADYSGTSTHVSLVDIAQGSAYNQRVGDKMRFKSAHISFTAIPGDSVNVLRLIVYQWHPLSTGSAPVPSSVLSNVSNAYAAISQYNVTNNQDFSILYDKSWNLNGYNNAQITKNVWIKGGKFLDRNIHFQAGSSTIKKNGIFALWISDSSAASHPQVIAVIRTRFTDA